MGQSFKIRNILLFATLAASTTFFSCEDDLFNPEKVKATYQDKFPVKDIDPQMDWKMTQQIDVSIAVNEDYGKNYTIEIFDHNPYDRESAAHLLASGTARHDMVFQTRIDCPNVLEQVFVSRKDEAGRRILKVVPIDNKRIETSFRSKPQSPFAQLRTANTRADESNISNMERPYSDEQIAEMLATATIYTGQRMSDEYWQKNITVFKIEGTYTGEIIFDGGLAAHTLKLIIPAGSVWEFSNLQHVNSGLEIIVAPGGKIKMSGSAHLEMVGETTVTVLGNHGMNQSTEENGIIEGTHGCRISNTNANTTSCFNGGIISGIDEVFNNGRPFYNYGTLSCGKYTGSGNFYNHGILEVDNFGGTDPYSSPSVGNTCTLKISGNLVTSGIATTPSSHLRVENLVVTGTVDLYANTILEITGTADFRGCRIIGPTAAEEYALLKINRIVGGWNGACTIINNVYIECDTNDSYTMQMLLPNDPSKNQYNNGNYIRNNEGTGQVTYGKYGYSPILIPESECTGEGNTPAEQGYDKEVGTSTTYTYVFEDNYPLVGDYDFNDVVLDVTPEYLRNADNQIQEAKLHIKLAATGAGKTLGCGLRLAGVPKSSVAQITAGGDAGNYQRTFSQTNFFDFNASTLMEDNDPDVVIPIFGNAHGVYENIPAQTLVNTGASSGGSSTTNQLFTYVITIVPTNQTQTEPFLSKDNLDFFICYQYKGKKERMEVHLYEFWGYGATAAGTIQKENLDVAGNNTWAICVPDFRYPKEYINICNESDESNSAYPKFLEWARNREASTDWYLYPNTANVYR